MVRRLVRRFAIAVLSAAYGRVSAERYETLRWALTRVVRDY